MTADIRNCEQCGTSFVPRREHARFCSARCRIAWNREHMGDSAAGVSALQWSITAMSDATERLSRARAADWPRAFAVIGEAVWWVTIVDATLVRHHPDAYDSVMAGQTAAQRQLVEGTLAGLRFVRNRIGDEADLAEFIEPSKTGPGAGEGRITSWTWRSVPEPALAALPPRGQAWEMTRYQAYQTQLAGHTIEETFGRAAEFLEAGDFTALTMPVPDEDYGEEEGRLRLFVRRHVERDRSTQLRRRKIDSVLQAGTALACEVCGFDFERAYGQRGKGYIDCHHILPHDIQDHN